MLSLNALNCWDPLKTAGHNVAGNGKREGLKTARMKQWEISSQATEKPVEGSTTTRSSLILIGTADRARTGRTFSRFFIWPTTDLARMVQGNVVLNTHDLKVIYPVVGLDAIDMVDDFTAVYQPTNGIFHDNAVLSDIPLGVCSGVAWTADKNIPSVVCNKTWVVFVGDPYSMPPGHLSDVIGADAEYVTDLLGSKSGGCHFGHHFDVDLLASIGAYPELLHVVQDEPFAYSMLGSNFFSGPESVVVFLEFIISDEKFFLCHECYISPNAAIYNKKRQDIVWTCSEIARSQDKEPDDNISEIKAFGDTVHINTIPSITIRDYNIGQKLTRERPAPSVVDLTVDKGSYWSVKVNKVQLAQAYMKFVEDWTDDAGEQMAISIDSAILGAVYSSASSYNAGNTAGYRSSSFAMGASGAPVGLDKTNIIDFIVDMGSVLSEYDVPKSNRWLALSEIFCNMIKKSDLKDASMTGDAQSITRNGRLGIIDKFMLYESNQIATTTDSTGETAHNIMAGHKSAITFASQLVENRTIPDPDDFGDIMEGLQVYGYKVVKEQALVHGYAYKM